MIVQVGSEVLTQVAKPVRRDEATRALFVRMLTAMESANGVGIAAPQLGVSKRMMIVASHPNKRYPYAPQIDPICMINPELLEQSAETELGWEGCLSVAGKRCQIERACHITVRYENDEREVIEGEFSGFIARIFLHELDHLNGITILDRAIEVVEI
uniref:peptide deformylase n=1 Tax=Thaumasiovibrio occultus TaxID=1891184 RepID=UPI000B34DA91|nr:peptide deformylase [Thaumasiovibrio occultus]